MRPTLTLVLTGMLVALAAARTRGSDPVARPMVDMPHSPQDMPNLGYLFPDLAPAAGALLAQDVPPARDDALVRTQVPEAVPRLPGRMPSSLPRTGAPAIEMPSPPLPRPAPGTEIPGPLPPSVVKPAQPQPAPPPETSAQNVAPPTDALAGFGWLAEPVAVQPGVTDPASAQGFRFDIPPPMIGDQAPFSLRANLAAAAGVPPVPPSPFAPQRNLGIALPWARGFKIADNMSPRPMDRLFFTFNYFNNLDGSINSRIAPGIGAMQAYRYLFGYERTFWDGNASIGIRLPLDTLSIGGRGTSTAVGNLTVFSKVILLQQQGTGNLLSGGLAVTAPTGPSAFGGAPGVFGYRDAQFQPFLGYYWTRGRFYVQGFEAIDVPTDPHDVTMQYNDVGVGYYVYRDADPRAFLSAIAPTFETHVNVPLNHVGAFRAYDPAGTADVVDLTFGVNVLLRQRSMLTFAFVDPVTGPRPFSQEWTILFNYFFGRTRNSPLGPTPPVAGL
ncbi:MAG: hypothetical protein P4L84_27725 [Isosphaeraceae bacterium]|nr:hypothetical protein [Isosphaeraceae bacterium]